MAVSVASAFERFRHDCVDLDVSTISEANESFLHFITYVSELGAEWFPPLEDGHALHGALTRRTAIQPLGELPLLVAVATRSNVLTSEQAAQPHPVEADMSSNLSRYSTDGKLDPSILADHMKSALDAMGNCGDVRIGRDRSVSFLFGNNPWQFRMTPAVVIKGAHGTVRHLMSPRRGLNWQIIDPEGDSSRMKDIDRMHNGHFLPLIRLLKHWNEHFSRTRFDPPYLEVLLAHLFGSADQSRLTSVPAGVARFFVLSKTVMAQPVDSQFGFARDMVALSNEDWEKVVDEHEILAKLANDALKVESEGDEAEAIGLWRRIFRKDFPSPT